VGRALGGAGDAAGRRLLVRARRAGRGRRRRPRRCRRAAFEGLAAPLPRAATATTVTPVAVRGSASVIEQATVDNEFAVVVELDDNDDAGAETYTVDLDIQPL
jgi:hypothetical protein